MANEIRSDVQTDSVQDQWFDGKVQQSTPQVTVNAGSFAAELDSARRTLQNLKRVSEEVESSANPERKFAEKERNLLFSLATERAAPAKPTLASVSPEQPSKPESGASDHANASSTPVSANDETGSPMALNVIIGDRYSALGNPAFGQTINLVSQRGELEISAYADPMGAAAQALAVMGATAQAMAKDLSRQQDQLAQTAQAVAVLKQQAELMSAVQQEYRIKSDMLGMMQNQQTGELTGLLGKAQALTTGAQVS